jgi:hypothetical protein
VKRRSFLGAMLAAAAAPAVVQSGILMPVKKIIDPWGPEAIGDRIAQAWDEARCWPAVQDHAIDAIRYGIYGGPPKKLRTVDAYIIKQEGPHPGQIQIFVGLGKKPLPVGWKECDGLEGRPDLRAFRKSA